MRHFLPLLIAAFFMMGCPNNEYQPLENIEDVSASQMEYPRTSWELMEVRQNVETIDRLILLHDLSKQDSTGASFIKDGFHYTIMSRGAGCDTACTMYDYIAFKIRRAASPESEGYIYLADLKFDGVVDSGHLQGPNPFPEQACAFTVGDMSIDGYGYNCRPFWQTELYNTLRRIKPDPPREVRF